MWVAFRQSTCKAKICNFHSWILTVVAKEDVHMLHIAMHNVILMNVFKPICYLLDDTFCPVLGQHLSLMNAEVVHQIATFSKFRDDVSELVLSEGLYERYDVLAFLAVNHSVSFGNAVLLFQLPVL